MDNKEFIKKHGLEFSLPTKEINAFEKVLKKANEHYVIQHTKEKGIRSQGLQYWELHIYCPTTSFAKAYWYIGLLYAKHVLPIWQKRSKKK